MKLTKYVHSDKIQSAIKGKKYFRTIKQQKYEGYSLTSNNAVKYHGSTQLKRQWDTN